MKRLLVLAGVMFTALLSATGVSAQQKVIKIGLSGDFSSAYSAATPVYSQGQRDYLAMINARGDLKGYTLEPIVVDHGNQPQRGLEAYERFKSEGAVAVDFISTPVARAVGPRATEDHIPVITMFHGRSDAADGATFPYLFPMSPNYWGQATALIQYILDQEKGNLKGKKIAFVGYDSPFGKEPQPVLESLAKTLGFEYQPFYYPLPGNEQSGQWTQVRRFRPDWVMIWGAGSAQPVAMKEALRNGIKLDHVVSNVWLAETETSVVGEKESTGVMRVEGVATGRDIPAVKAMIKEVVDKGKSAGPAEKAGQTNYCIGAATMAVVVEGIRLAIANEGAPLTSEKVKRGLERIKNFDAEGLMPPITVTAADHSGGSKARVSQYDGKKWVPKSDWMAPFNDLVWREVRASAEQFKKSSK